MSVTAQNCSIYAFILNSKQQSFFKKAFTNAHCQTTTHIESIEITADEFDVLILVGMRLPSRDTVDKHAKLADRISDIKYNDIDNIFTQAIAAAREGKWAKKSEDREMVIRHILKISTLPEINTPETKEVLNSIKSEAEDSLQNTRTYGSEVTIPSSSSSSSSTSASSTSSSASVSASSASSASTSSSSSSSSTSSSSPPASGPESKAQQKYIIMRIFNDPARDFCNMLPAKNTEDLTTSECDPRIIEYINGRLENPSISRKPLLLPTSRTNNMLVPTDEIFNMLQTLPYVTKRKLYMAKFNDLFRGIHDVFVAELKDHNGHIKPFLFQIGTFNVMCDDALIDNGRGEEKMQEISSSGIADVDITEVPRFDIHFGFFKLKRLENGSFIPDIEHYSELNDSFKHWQKTGMNSQIKI